MKNTARPPILIGGLFFYLSLLSLCILAVSNLCALAQLINIETLKRLRLSFLSSAGGYLVATVFFRAHLAVFIHELKHSIVSNLAGNKAVELKVKRDSGHFAYKYTEDTAQYNALISLAPYFFPLFTILSLIAACFLRQGSFLQISMVAFAAGMDYRLNMRDISPHQTDLTGIRGGYGIALLFLAGMNISILTFLGAWLIRDFYGVRFLVFKLSEWLLRFAAM